MKTALIITAALLIAISLPAFTQEFPDVPPDHWAYDAVQELVNLGIIQGYPDGTYGGRRAMSRYEFAEAIARAVPAIAEAIQVEGGLPGLQGPAGPAGPQGPPGAGAEQVQALQRLVDEFRDELAALGVDVDALRRDVAALNERVTVLEEEVARVRFFGEANLIGRGEVANVAGADSVFDRDSRELSVPFIGQDRSNLLANSEVFTDLAFGMRARVSDDAVVSAVISAGDYLPFAIGVTDEILLWNLNLDGAMRLGPLGAAHVVAGRFPFQLTPLTMKFPVPDSYASVTRLDAGDYILDGGRASMNLGPVGITLFGGKTDGIGGILTPSLQLDTPGGEAIAQVGGVRAVIGTGALGNVGLTYYQAGGSSASNLRAEIMGADINTAFGPVGLTGEYAQTEPNTNLLALYPGTDEDNIAWNAKLNFQAGRLAIGAGYTTVEANYFAPGYWMDLGRLVNPTNVKGPVADLSFALAPRIKLVASGTQLEPNDVALPVQARTNIDRGIALSAPGGDVDKLTAWKAGLQFGLTAANTIDLGYEQVTLSPTVGNDVEERYISIGLGHSFNPNASLKLLYQIIEAEDPDLLADGNYRGGVATAQFQLKY